MAKVIQYVKDLRSGVRHSVRSVSTGHIADYRNPTPVVQYSVVMGYDARCLTADTVYELHYRAGDQTEDVAFVRYELPVKLVPWSNGPYATFRPLSNLELVAEMAKLNSKV